VDTFCNRIESVVFNGDSEWSEVDIRRAVGLAKRVQWVFRDPQGDKARRLYERISLV
jgi:hypothetical protein